MTIPTSVTQVRSDLGTADLNAQTGKWSVTDEEELQVYCYCRKTFRNRASYLRAGRNTTVVFIQYMLNVSQALNVGK